MVAKGDLYLDQSREPGATPLPPPDIGNMVTALNNLNGFTLKNRCILFMTAVTDIENIQFTNYALVDKVFAVGLNNNTVFPLIATEQPYSIPWDWTPPDAVNIANQIKQAFLLEKATLV